MIGWVILAAFIGGFAGSLLADLIPPYVVEPLRVRARHKRIMEREAFVEDWGRNPVAFFVRKDGFNRAPKRMRR